MAHECVHEYNSTTHSSTGFVPHHLLFGTSINIVPEELKIETNIKKDREKAYENSIKIHNYNKRKYDKGRKEIKLKIGDLVYCM